MERAEEGTPTNHMGRPNREAIENPHTKPKRTTEPGPHCCSHYTSPPC
ncbi:hypothetical protein T07_9913 [Trichinella nelsoni]|uniref:Uncharacterized protein n=1 Tax=Trichinella nelsoni TaxID=6336 RepID=A0A0V0RAB3_9BILA|nr:hypothetical protein T07_9913 [Trichinella nelsoni]